MVNPEVKIFQKDNIKITLTYTGENYLYDVLETDDDSEIDLWAKEVGSLLITLPNNTTLNFCEYLPKSVRFLGPVEHYPGRYYHDEGYITLGDLTIKGNLLEILHEIGHALVNERYQENTDDFEVKRERHAWGWALSVFKKLGREGKDLEPKMTEQEIKQFIKESLLSHEVMERAHRIGLKREKINNLPPRYWRSVSEKDLTTFIDQMYNNSNCELTEDMVPKEKLKNTFRLK